ncbi:MAG: DUF3253 domain-containing protein [Pseudomonadota bacterium]
MSGRPTDAEIVGVILDLCRKRGPEKTICPSEAAKLLAGERFDPDWRCLMDDVRDAAGRLAEKGLIEVCQRGKAVSIAGAKGPIRLRVRPDGS